MRVLLSLLALLLAAALPLGQARALDYPTRPVRVIMPFTAGGAPDVLLRLVAQKLSEKWGQGVVVENRAGGNTLIGTVAGDQERARRLHAADGRRPDLHPQSAALATLPYSMKELDPIILMASIPHMLAVSQQGAGVEREGADRARQGKSPTR